MVVKIKDSEAPLMSKCRKDKFNVIMYYTTSVVTY